MSKGTRVDNSKRAFAKELKKVLEQADVVLEILDARNPQEHRCKAVEEQILASGKRLVLVLNKADLIPRNVLADWLRYLHRYAPCVAFSSIQLHSKDKMSDSITKRSGADDLMQLLKNYCRNKGIKTSISVGVIGYPNVGKSSLINALKRTKACKVGATPGITTTSQRVHLDKLVTLVDCPGIVFDSDASTSSLTNCLRVEQIEDPLEPVSSIWERIGSIQLCTKYGISNVDSFDAFIQAVGRRLGKLGKGGVVDQDGTAKMILRDWNEGKISYFTTPPVTVDEISIAPSWATEFIAVPEEDHNEALDVHMEDSTI